jgi:hypothetical protein
LDLAVWWEWERDPDAEFMETTDAITAWTAEHGTAPRQVPWGRNTKRERTDAEEQESDLGRKLSNITQAVKAVGGKEAYSKAYPGRYRVLDAAGWWAWKEEKDLDSGFLGKVDEVSAFFARRGERPSSQAVVRHDRAKGKRAAGECSDAEEKAAEAAREVRLAQWINGVQAAVKKAGFTSKWPQRAAALEQAPWWLWPVA